ncbi:MAG TPA: 7-cyano-7-deazaguanine synthase QueC [bacterium]|nr:7-cyano-7-deazaguanine synthase QueC [bacterium]HPS30017.1 7-cyano-7-deazaguanine synthase QueC [bacterium]
MNKRAVILFSGGLDSATVLALALSRGYELFPLTIVYGQRHLIEVEKSRKTLEKYGIADRSTVFNIDLSLFSKCSLINKDMAVPDKLSSEIPTTYVPSRNLIFLSIASGFAETMDAGTIFIGVNAVDYSGYPDCRPEFIEAFNKTISKGTKMGVEKGISVEAPLIRMSKKDIIQLGISLNVDYSLTHSCYNPSVDGKSCGICDSCRLRLAGFRQAGLPDPIDYL